MRRSSIFPSLVLAVSLATVGCGAGLNAASNNQFTLQASADHLTTAGKVHLEARTFAGADAHVLWSVSGGDDESGPGSIDASGNYTPPSYLRASSVKVQVTAALANDATTFASVTLTVTPAVSISPQNLALAPGSQARLYASVAQVGSGSVQWGLTLPGSSSQAAASGTFSGSHCTTSKDSFTQCSVLYTAPSGMAQPIAEASIQASLRNVPASSSTARLLLNAAATASPLENEAPQTGADVLGTSGGNAHDSANQYCCGGTLGALVTLGGQPYVLSNNHVLARTDQSNPGESILQPGLLDTDCGYAPSYTVASLSYFPRLQDPTTNVDVAIAQAGSGALDPSGAILGFGTASNGVLANAAPARDPEDITQPGAHVPSVVKAGRTTGLTCGSISQIAVDFRVDYNTSCDGSGEQFNKTFTNQIAISGAAFADSGDSGALLADQATAQPVGLLFAGNATETFANPIADVLHSLSGFAAERNPNDATVAMVGGDHHPVTCLKYEEQATVTAAPVPAPRMVAAQETATRLRSELLATIPGLLDVAVGSSLDAPGEPALVLYLDSAHMPAAVPAWVDSPGLSGLRTQIVATTAAELAVGHPPVTPPAMDLATLPRNVLDAAIAVKQRYSATLRQDPAVFGVGVGRSMDAPNEAAIVLFVDKNAAPRALPHQLGGFRVQTLLQDPPRAFDWKHAANASLHHASCSLRAASLDLPY